MRFGTHRVNYDYAPIFKAWENAANCGTDWKKWQDLVQQKTPAVNIVENETNFTIEVAAPGLQKEYFKIEVKNNQLTVWSEAKSQENAQENTKKYSRQEFGFGNFKRSFTLPESVDSENISAKYADGILYVAIPKLEKAKTGRSVNID